MIENIETVLIDNVNYGIVNEVKDNDVVYVFLAELENENNQMIRKYKVENKNMFLPLNSKEEVQHALELLKDNINM